MKSRDKACISSNDNKNIDTVAENFSGFKLTYTPPPRGCTKKLKTESSLCLQNGCDGLGLTGKISLKYM